MELKDILVHFDDRRQSVPRLDLALQLARQYEAQLTAIYVSRRLSVFAKGAGEVEADPEAARQLFVQKCDETGISGEWVHVDGTASGLDLTEAVNLHAHYHDLLIVGQEDPEAASQELLEMPMRTVISAGRPVLIIPYAGSFDSIGKRVLLAWRGGPESARALKDALPLLRQAREVHVIAVKTPGFDFDFGPYRDFLVRHLALHGIEATVEAPDPAGLSVGDLLLNRAADLGSDLLVMGAFSQSWRGKPAIGEVGRHLLRCMTIPVLMSH